MLSLLGYDQNQMIQNRNQNLDSGLPELDMDFQILVPIWKKLELGHSNFGKKRI